MSEIRFRARRMDNGEWAYFNWSGAYVDESGNEITPKRFTRDCGFKVDPETVGQFTGLSDKNGAAIYEGDVIILDQPVYEDCSMDKVVEYRRRKGQIVMRHCAWQINIGRRYYPLFWADVEDVPPECFDVLGNIHEHPHLLEGETQT